MATMPESISIAEFRRAIERLPSDQPRSQPGVWYQTQKEHWLGWLREYEGPGAYGRKPNQSRDAKFAYNHVVCPEMLLWLIEAAGVRQELVTGARSRCDRHDHDAKRGCDPEAGVMVGSLRCALGAEVGITTRYPQTPVTDVVRWSSSHPRTEGDVSSHCFGVCSYACFGVSREVPRR